MVEYSIMAFKNLSFSIGTGSRELMVYFSFGGLIIAVMGYWVKKWTGVIISIIGILFLYLYFTGFFSRIMG